MTGFLKTVSLLACALSSTQVAFATFLPKNKLHLQDNKNRIANITKEQFNTIINDIVKKYQPIVERIHKAKLSTNNLWDDPTVNAYAQQFSGSDWQINMFGGLARRPEVTPDGFAMVVCHELGHHLAGFPFYGPSDWAASEGQSDYFATQACARFVWSNQVELNAAARDKVSAFAKQKCDAQWQGVNEQNLCYRASLAGESLAVLLGALGEPVVVPKFETPDPTQVNKTYTAHPEAQCRLDTYFAGALANATFNNELIPGKGFKDRTSLEAEKETLTTSATVANAEEIGVRPRCWFKPGIAFLGTNLVSINMLDGNSQPISFAKPGQTIKLDAALSNNWSKDVFDVNASLKSNSTNATVTQNNASYGDIVAGTTKQSGVPFELSIAEQAKCGTKVDVATTASSVLSNGRKMNADMTGSFMIGRIISTFLGQVETSQEIPDNKPAGITQTLISNASGDVSKVKVGIKFTHAFPIDLEVKLTSPNGVKKNVYLQNAHGGQNDLSLEVTGFSGSAAGTWTLHVADLDKPDVGTLQGWSVTAVQGSCE